MSFKAFDLEQGRPRAMEVLDTGTSPSSTTVTTTRKTPRTQKKDPASPRHGRHAKWAKWALNAVTFMATLSGMGYLIYSIHENARPPPYRGRNSTVSSGVERRPVAGDGIWPSNRWLNKWFGIGNTPAQPIN